MEKLNELGQQISQITLYDIKSYYNQAKNMVLNVSEMEAKVREATNDDPWGASSTLMQDIAQGTFNFQQFNEIMPCIYARFMEKEARQWREIYKALQLLEYLIKHGSERVVDDARSHLSTVKMLRNFHYIDEKGKDQGINVRNRASEIASLLMDLDRVRGERRKAKANRTKYTGVGSDGFGGGGSGRYGGMGSDSFYSGSSGGGGGYSGGGGGSSDYYSGGGGSSSAGGARKYEDYDAGDDEISSPRRDSLRSPTTPAQRTPTTTTTTSTQAAAKAKVTAPAVIPNLLDWDGDEDTTTTAAVAAPTTSNANKALPNVFDTSADDEFDAFQSAPVSPPAYQASTATSAAKLNVFDVLNHTQPTTAAPPVLSRAPTQQTQPGWQQTPLATQPQPARPNYFGGATPLAATPGVGGMGGATNPISPVRSNFTGGAARSSPAPASTQGHASTKSSSNFDDLLSFGLGMSAKPAAAPSGAGKSIKDLEREKAQAGIWRASQGPSQSSQAGFGAFGSFTSGASAPAGGSGAASSGGDDLLL
ncbi:hypothetical protein M422DRAFT_24460 [Sphaerobolus stellatus SS14]|nr:hypothetical protein M422DRAFT_24460 [Sphaerobolus stellatus SS14]